ncbi:hypothetical protein V6Z11_D09G003000 [Gossypium hirsutum]
MVILGRIRTKDKLCKLSNSELETRNHLFFECSYSKGIWKSILGLCRIDREIIDWQRELQWAYIKLKGKTLIAIIVRTAWNAYVYLIWEERNRRQFKGKQRNESEILNSIKELVAIRLSGKSIDRFDVVNFQLCTVWNILESSA